MSGATETMGASVRHAIEAVNADGRTALVCYLPAGYPDLDTSVACLVAAAASGADVLEVGFPFSDPIMDGPTIQAACQTALGAGYRVDDFLEVARRVTGRTGVPSLVMTYFTIPYARGLARFADDAAAAGLRGAILPDLPAQESGEWTEAARGAGLETVFLAAPVSTDGGLASIAGASTGFVYATGLLGVTGTGSVQTDTARDLVARIRAHATVPVCVGVGVSTPVHAAAVAAYADGVIVGSAIVRAAGEGGPDAVAELVGALRRGVDGR